MAVHIFWQFALVVDSRPESTWLATTCLMALTSSSDSCNSLAENKHFRIGMKALSATGLIFPRPTQAIPVGAVRHYCLGRFPAGTRGCQGCCCICDNPNYSPSRDEWHRADHELPQSKDNELFLLMRSSVLRNICPQQHMEGATAHSSRCEALLSPSRARATMMASIIPPSNAGECQPQQAYYLYSPVPSYSSTAVCFFLDKNLPWWLIAWLQLLTRYPIPTSYYSKCV